MTVECFSIIFPATINSVLFLNSPPPPPFLLQRLVEAAEEAHLQHDEDPDLQVFASPSDFGHKDVFEFNALTNRCCKLNI